MTVLISINAAMKISPSRQPFMIALLNLIPLETYGRDIAQIAFEVRSLDGERLVESTQVADFEQEDSVIRFDITLKDLIEYDTDGVYRIR